MKKNWTVRIGATVCALTLVTAALASGTFAKYIEHTAAQDSARVAKFDYTTTLGTKATMTQAINLFDTVNDAEVGAADNNKAADGTTKLIAPGTSGNFTVTTTNASEVDVDVTYVLTETNDGNVPTVYAVDGVYYSDFFDAEAKTFIADTENGVGTEVTIAGDLAAMSTAMHSVQLKNTVNGTGAELVDTSDISWFWAFEGETDQQTDAVDTALGNAGTATVAINIDATVTQIN